MCFLADNGFARMCASPALFSVLEAARVQVRPHSRDTVLFLFFPGYC